jgi:hypothetical protein
MLRTHDPIDIRNNVCVGFGFIGLQTLVGRMAASHMTLARQSIDNRGVNVDGCRAGVSVSGMWQDEGRLEGVDIHRA